MQHVQIKVEVFPSPSFFTLVLWAVPDSAPVQYHLTDVAYCIEGCSCSGVIRIVHHDVQ